MGRRYYFYQWNDGEQYVCRFHEVRFSISNFMTTLNNDWKIFLSREIGNERYILCIDRELFNLYFFTLL